MTGTYDSKPIPHHLDVVCPACSHRADFEFSETVRIKRRSDVEFFQKSSMFQYLQFQDSCGHFWHGALYFQGLHGNPRQAIHELPDGYSAQDWEHSRYFRHRVGWEVGSIRCGFCHVRGMHVLNWPDEAYYSIEYRGHILWAFHRESAIDLLQYLQSTERNVSQYRWAYFLMHVPSVFKLRKARGSVIKKTGQTIGCGA